MYCWVLICIVLISLVGDSVGWSVASGDSGLNLGRISSRVCAYTFLLFLNTSGNIHHGEDSGFSF